MSQNGKHHELHVPAASGKVAEEKEKSPAIEAMHITEGPEAGPVEDVRKDRERTESTTSVNSEAWQNSEEMLAKLNVANHLLETGTTPLDIIKQLFPRVKTDNLETLSENMHMEVLSELFEQTPSRRKLREYNTLQDAIELFRTRKNILFLTGAGVSVSCGIPDFRSRDGIYARLRGDFPDLPDPTSMFDIRYFRSNPAPFYNFAREIFPGQFVPSVSHRFIKEIENEDRLLRNYTQNIDTLEHQTGIKKVVECHGSFSKCTCTTCGQQFEGDAIREEVLKQTVPYCKCGGVIKPNIVFFGEDLGDEFHRHVGEDKTKVDLIVVIGSSLKVRPVSMIPHCVDKSVPQILINRESLPHYEADIELLGNCDDIIRDICYNLGGSFVDMVTAYDSDVASSSKQPKTVPSQSKRHVITHEEFLETPFNRHPSFEIAENDSEEPNAKKPRVGLTVAELRLQRLEKRDEEETRRKKRDFAVEENSNVWLATLKRYPRYLEIDEIYKDNKCLTITKHQTLFPGSEYIYDLEDMKLVHERPYTLSESSSDGSGASSSSSQLSYPGISRSTSSCDLTTLTNKDTFPDFNRSHSCYPNLQYELSEALSAVDFRSDYAHEEPGDM